MYLSPRLRKAGRIIRGGGVVAYPTEGVYGLGCRPDDGLAVGRLLALKGRGATAGLILIAADPGQLGPWIDPDPQECARLERDSGHPGSSPTPSPVTGTSTGPGTGPITWPITWVVTASLLAPQWITGGRSTVAVRLTAHPLARGLCVAAGMAIVSTSANPHGRPPARSAGGVRRYFPQGVDLILGGQTLGARGPSEIRMARTGEVLRRG